MEKAKSIPAGPLVAVDIGGSKFITGLLDAQGTVLYSERREWNGVQQADIVRQIAESLWALRDAHPAEFAAAQAGGLTIPGFADPVRGVWVESDFLKVKDLPICDILAEEFGIPFYADNDCNACALAEQYFGGAQQCGSFLYLTISTGIGGALVLDGAVHYGAFDHAGEIGLVVMEKNGHASDSGTPGVLEAQACGRGLVENYLAAGGRSEIDGAAPDGRVLARLAGEGDAAALAAMELEGRYLGRAIADVCALIDPEKVILGGGVSLLFEHYGPALQREFSRCCPLSHAEIAPTQLGYLGAFLGAGALALRGACGALPAPHAPGQPDVLALRADEGRLFAALTLSGKPYRGAQGRAGDIGAYCAAAGIRDEGTPLQTLFAEALQGRTLPALTAEAQAGGAGALEALARLGEALGRAAALACVVLDPSSVVLQGALGEALPFLWPAMKRALDAETYYHGRLPFDVRAE